MTGGALAAAGPAGFYTWRIEPEWLEVIRRPLPIAGLPLSLVGRTLVQLSDIHVGPRVDDDYILATFRRVRDLAPDLVVITGDFMSYRPGQFPRVERVYREIPHGRLATVGVLGNHDYGMGWRQPHVAQMLVDIVRPLGVTVLRNEVVDVEGLQIAGLDDLWAHQFQPERGLSMLDAGRAAIVLSHNPDTVDLPGWGDYAGWILSGHTHGGQCRPPFLPPPILPVKNKRYAAGEVSIAGGRRLYINRGVGHVMRVRFNVRPEVTIFDLVAV